MSDRTNDEHSGSNSDESTEEDTNERASTSFAPDVSAIKAIVSGSKIQEQMAANQEIINRLATGSDFQEQIARDQEAIDQLVSNSDITDQIVSNQKMLDQIATGSKIQEQMAANREIINQIATGSEFQEQMAMNQEVISQLATSSEMMDQIRADQEMIDRLVSGSEFQEQSAANQEVLNQLVAGSEMMEQLSINQRVIDQLQQPAIDPELVNFLEGLDVPPIIELYETAAVLEQFSQGSQDSSINQEGLSNPTPPESNGFLSTVLALSANYLLNSDEDLSSETTTSLNTIINTEDAQVKVHEFGIAIRSLSERGTLLAITGLRYSILFSTSLYFPPDANEDSSEDE